MEGGGKDLHRFLRIEHAAFHGAEGNVLQDRKLRVDDRPGNLLDPGHAGGILGGEGGDHGKTVGPQ